MRESTLTRTLSVVDTDSKVTTTNETKLRPGIDTFESDICGRWIRQLSPISTPAKDVGEHG